MKPKQVKPMAIGCLLLYGLSAKAGIDEIPCIIFSGHSTEECRLPLSGHNRIYFGDNGMTIRSSGEKDIELLYSLFNRLAFRDAVPTGIQEVQEAGDDSRIVFNQTNKSLHIEAPAEETFMVRVFDLSGRSRLAGKLKAEEELDLHSLSAGVYIATAINGDTKLNLKLIIK